MTAPLTLDRDAIAQRIPHQGSMCLLERVTAWDTEQIMCEANNQQAPDHPLRAYGQLGAACGIEYAAQAMAVHGALLAQTSGVTSVPRVGFLASVRSVTLHVERLDDVAQPLNIWASRISDDGNTILYQFSLTAGATPLLSGRATVVLDARIKP